MIKFQKLQCLFIVFAALSLEAAVLPAAEIHITGRVLSDSGRALENAQVDINGVAASTDISGQFSVMVDSADLYRLGYSAENHFPMIHNFSALEFGWRPQVGREHGTVVPDVTLVERKKGRIMLAFGGDTMLGRRFLEPAKGEPVLVREGHRAEDAAALLRHIGPHLQLADFTSVNLETQVMEAKPEANAPKSYVFFSPPELLDALVAAGIDYVTLGNNHTFDYLSEGLVSTIDALEASGLAWSGAGRTEADSLGAHRARVGGSPLSLLGYVGWAGNFSPNQVAQGAEKGGAAHGTEENIRKSVRREVDAGYLPIVQYHGSREYTDEPTLVTETRLKQSIDDGAILAIGHHPHIVQGFEIYNGRLIAYSMGNFMFDQFHYATTHSYLVYIWMDGDRLHRAEVMPLHIKGYVPMPATDTTRLAILRRVNELSSRRGVFMQPSGGNAVILPQSGANKTAPTLTLSPVDKSRREGASVWPLNQQSWHTPVASITLNRGETERVRLGKNLLPTGHLESHSLLGAADRAWIEEGHQSIVTEEAAPSGKNVMHLVIPATAGQGRIGMRTFEYTFEPGTPTTFVVRARADAPARVMAYQQWRKRNEDRLEALKSAKLRPIGQRELGTDGWQELRFDFDSPRVTAISYRVVLEVTPLDPGADHESWFDDIALIEWLSPPLSSGDVPLHVAGGQASHLGLTQTPSMSR